MSLTGIITLPKLALTVMQASPYRALLSRPGLRVYPYQTGAMVRTAATAATALLTSGLGEFAQNDYLIVCTKTSYGQGFLFVPDTTKIRRVTSDPSAAVDDTVTVNTAVTVAQGDYLFNLGADTVAGVNLDGSTLSLYDDNAGQDANSDGYFLTGTGGSIQGWLESGVQVADLLITDTSKTPIVALPFITLGAEVVS